MLPHHFWHLYVPIRRRLRNWALAMKTHGVTGTTFRATDWASRSKTWKPTSATKHFVLLDTGLSEQARTKARTIINLEPILAEVEGPRRRFPRDPDLYNLVIFGTPGSDTTWSWRFEGHHVSVNYTIVNGTLVAPTPVFFGSNPAQVRHGEHEGLRALKEEEDLARDLLASLDGEQKRVAIISDEAPADILTRNVPQRK